MICQNIKKGFNWIPIEREMVQYLLQKERNTSGLFSAYINMTSNAAYKAGIMTKNKLKQAVYSGDFFGGLVELRRTVARDSFDNITKIAEKLYELGLIAFNKNKSGDIETYNYSIENYIHLNADQGKPTNYISPSQKGFFAISKSIADKFIGADYYFTELDAWYDLYIATLFGEYENPFSFLGAVVQFGNNPVTCYSELASRWKWGKQKVYNFFKKYSEDFKVVTLKSNKGSVIFNTTKWVFEGNENKIIDTGAVYKILELTVNTKLHDSNQKHISTKIKGAINPMFKLIGKIIKDYSNIVFKVLKASGLYTQEILEKAKVQISTLCKNTSNNSSVAQHSPPLFMG